MRYSGTVEELRQAIAGSGIRVQRVEDKDNLHIIRTETGAICTLTPSTGKLVVQGKPDEQATLEAVVSKFVERHAKKQAKQSNSSPAGLTKSKPKNLKVFIVHGHDMHARDQLTLLLNELGLKPFILARSAGAGLTIIEALEKEIRPGSDAAAFGIVLLTGSSARRNRVTECTALS